jgi:DNA mismatch repair protein MutS2
MYDKLFNFSKDNKLSPFRNTKSITLDSSLFKTSDAKKVQKKVIDKINSFFSYKDTENLLYFIQSFKENFKFQDYFLNLKKVNNNIFKDITEPKETWKPKYSIIVVTEDEKLFMELKREKIPVSLIQSIHDINELSSYDVIQAINCDDFSIALESIPQLIFLNSIDEVYLERYLSFFSSWEKNLELIENNLNNIDNFKEIKDEFERIIKGINPLFVLLKEDKRKELSEEEVYDACEKINNQISKHLKEMTISGDELVLLLQSKKIPEDIKRIIDNEINSANYYSDLFIKEIPLKVNEDFLREEIKRQETDKFTDFSNNIKKHSQLLKDLPNIIYEIESLLIIYDFLSGISNFISKDYNSFVFDSFLSITNSKNIFLNNPQDISFNLKDSIYCSILTGANSGGKTTLLEHILQIVALTNLGFPISGKVIIPKFTDVYYYAKNKGSMNKGAFETLLTQIAKTKYGESTLILFDEIESVTEPGVAADIICAISKYFIEKKCFIICATHLGKDIQKNISKGARIDGIEAKGLDDNFELIIDRNPVLGRLAHSTPELIIERLSQIRKEDFFKFLNEYIKNK